MRVSICEKCEHSERRVWSRYYQPRNFHAIGMSHAYRYCNLYGERCAKVKDCPHAWVLENKNKDGTLFHVQAICATRPKE